MKTSLKLLVFTFLLCLQIKLSVQRGKTYEDLADIIKNAHVSGIRDYDEELHHKEG